MVHTEMASRTAEIHSPTETVMNMVVVATDTVATADTRITRMAMVDGATHKSATTVTMVTGDKSIRQGPDPVNGLDVAFGN